MLQHTTGTRYEAYGLSVYNSADQAQASRAALQPYCGAGCVSTYLGGAWERTERSVITPYGTSSSLPLVRPSLSDFLHRTFLVWYHSRTRRSGNGGGPLRHLPFVLQKYFVQETMDGSAPVAMPPTWCYNQCPTAEQCAKTCNGLVGQWIENWNAKIINDSSHPLNDPNSSIGFDVPKEKWLAGWRQSKFCLVIRGDTVSTHALYSAIKSGCIPVVISDMLQYSGLPFTHQSASTKLDDFAVKISELEFYAHPERIAPMLAALDQSVIAAKLKALESAQRELLYNTEHTMLADMVLSDCERIMSIHTGK
jgi:hypothetical protein